MGNREDDMLAREHGKIGSLWGMCGSLGASLAARFLPTEQCQEQVNVPRDAATVLTELAAFLASEGRIAGDQEAGTSQCPKLSAILGSGFLRKNPTVVHVQVIGVDNDSCTLLVRGVAKEGLIKQRSAEKVVSRIVEFLGTIG